MATANDASRTQDCEVLGDVAQVLAELLAKCSHRHLAFALERVD